MKGIFTFVLLLLLAQMSFAADSNTGSSYAGSLKRQADGLACNDCPSGNILYVRAGSAGDGSSWSNAFSHLTEALALAQNCSNITQIWVAAGTYKPSEIVDNTARFVLINGVSIYGGFPATGTPGFADRDWEAFPAVLSGDLLGNDDDAAPINSLLFHPSRWDNCYTVVLSSNTDHTAVIDGFIIKGGNANGSSAYSYGGGIRNLGGSPTVRNCTFSRNSASSSSIGGGAISNYGGAPNISSCKFMDNFAPLGGAISNQQGSMQLTACSFHHNYATVEGGALHNQGTVIVERSSFTNNQAGLTPGLLASGGAITNRNGGNLQLINSRFSGNTCIGYNGSALGNIQSAVWIYNSTFSHNIGNYVIETSRSNTSITNSIIWDNNTVSINGTATVSYSIIQGGAVGEGNLDEDPLFSDAANGDFRLQACSPAVDAGSNSNVPQGIHTDLDGNPRFFQSGTVDMGAYEYQSPVIIVTCYADNDGDGYGVPGISQDHCQTCPEGYANNALDCDDNNLAIHPGATEVCDGVDNDCSGAIDDAPECQDECLTGPDSDCDGVADICDLCPGGDDSIDNNGDGLPDCYYYPGASHLPVSWTCSNNSNNEKVRMCNNGVNICVSENAIAAHIAQGGFIGPCGNSTCNDQNLSAGSGSAGYGEFIETGFSAFPNPARETVIILLDGAVERGTLSLLDMQGRRLTILALDPGVLQYDLNLGSMPAGTYLLRLQTEREMVTKRLMVMHD